MDFLLISPPVANFGQATSGLSVLTAFLRSRGWNAHQWDLAIDAFHHFHSPEYLHTRLEILEQAADEELIGVARRTIQEIDAAKNALRTPGIEADHDRMRWAFSTINDAGIVMTAAAGGGYEHDFRHFAIPNAFRNFETLGQAIADPERNPYLEFMREHALPRIARDKPKAVGISMTYFSQVVPGLTLLRLLHEEFPEIRVVLGGAYLTAVEEQVEGMSTAVFPADCMILHDGEEPLDAWLRLVLTGEGSLEQIPNTHIPHQGTFQRVGQRNLTHTDLDLLPVPMWIADGLDLERYLVPRYPIPLPLSRGCYWGRCSFCNISCQTDAAYRTRSVDKALQDMKHAIAETGSNWFDFPVDSFRPKELRKLAQGIIADGIEINWGAEVLLDPGFKDSIIEELAQSGCRCLRFGLESACEETLVSMNKPTRPEGARRILAACTANGIQTAVMLIAGFPSESQAQLTRTFDYLADNSDRIDFLTIHQYSLVPGSPMANEPDRFGIYPLPQEAVLWTSIPFVNTNPVAMKNEDLPRVVDAMREGLKQHYPDLGELWTVAIGGWMTFPACCGVREDFMHPVSGG